jgi:hypothetical protein
VASQTVAAATQSPMATGTVMMTRTPGATQTAMMTRTPEATRTPQATNTTRPTRTPMSTAMPTGTADSDRVTICHATGSRNNPYVEITVSREAAMHHQANHEDDIVPAPPGGCPRQ